MTLELKMLALSIVLGLVQVVLASHAASMQRGYVWTAFSGRGRAQVDWNRRPTGAGAAQFRRDISSVRRSRAHCSCCRQTQLDDRMGCSALFLGSSLLCRPLRSGGFPTALPCLERGGARDQLDPSIDALTHRSTIRTKACLYTRAPHEVIDTQSGHL